MTKTDNIELIKPDENDFYNINDSNTNMDKIDTEIGKLEAPEYEPGIALEEPVSGESIFKAFGKIKKAVSALISHIPALATASAAGHVRLAFTETVYKNGTYALDAVQANAGVRGTLAHQVLQHDVELINKLSGDNISSSSAVTESSMYVLDAREKNATVSGTLANQIDTLNTNLINRIYPIGSIYMSVNNVSPAKFIGGAWEPLKDRFLIGAGNSYSVNSAGGEVNHTLMVNELPANFPTQRGYLTDMGTTESITMGVAMNSFPAGTWKACITYLQEGGGAAHNNMPPYLAVYMWKRTA